MMTNKLENPPAFPLPSVKYGNVWRDQEGMTLRDYFAAAALRGELSCQVAAKREWNESNISELAQHSYSIADAMMKARKNDNA